MQPISSRRIPPPSQNLPMTTRSKRPITGIVHVITEKSISSNPLPIGKAKQIKSDNSATVQIKIANVAAESHIVEKNLANIRFDAFKLELENRIFGKNYFQRKSINFSESQKIHMLCYDPNIIAWIDECPYLFLKDLDLFLKLMNPEFKMTADNLREIFISQGIEEDSITTELLEKLGKENKIILLFLNQLHHPHLNKIKSAIKHYYILNNLNLKRTRFISLLKDNVLSIDDVVNSLHIVDYEKLYLNHIISKVSKEFLNKLLNLPDKINLRILNTFILIGRFSLSLDADNSNGIIQKKELGRNGFNGFLINKENLIIIYELLERCTYKKVNSAIDVLKEKFLVRQKATKSEIEYESDILSRIHSRLGSEERLYIAPLMQKIKTVKSVLLFQKRFSGDLLFLQKAIIGYRLLALYKMGLGISQIHKAGYVHYDIKPKNVLFAGEEPFYLPKEVVVIDFGGAREITTSCPPFFPFATRRYCPPEYIDGVRLQLVDPSFDSWSYGMSIIDLIFPDVKDIVNKYIYINIQIDKNPEEDLIKRKLFNHRILLKDLDKAYDSLQDSHEKLIIEHILPIAKALIQFNSIDRISVETAAAKLKEVCQQFAIEI